MNVEDIGDLFLYELRGAYFTETMLVEQLAEMAEQANIETLDELSDTTFREDVHETFSTHRDQTETHVERLEEVFDLLDRQPETRDVPAVEGLFTEKERFNNLVLNDAVRPLYYLDVETKVEQLEVQCYDSLLQLASVLGLDSEIVENLEANRDEDDETRRRVTELTESKGANDVLESLADETSVV